MAENPQTWGPLEKAIYEALGEHGKMLSKGVFGTSLPRFIADKLREKGLVKEEIEHAAEQS